MTLLPTKTWHSTVYSNLAQAWTSHSLTLAVFSRCLILWWEGDGLEHLSDAGLRVIHQPSSKHHCFISCRINWHHRVFFYFSTLIISRPLFWVQLSHFTGDFWSLIKSSSTSFFSSLPLLTFFTFTTKLTWPHTISLPRYSLTFSNDLMISSKVYTSFLVIILGIRVQRFVSVSSVKPAALVWKINIAHFLFLLLGSVPFIIIKKTSFIIAAASLSAERRDPSLFL